MKGTSPSSSNGSSAGSDQQAYVIFPPANAVDMCTSEKSHNSASMSDGTIKVIFDITAQHVEVWGYSSANGWVKADTDIRMQFMDGDRIRADLLDDGTIEIYRNGNLQTQRKVSGLSRPVVNMALASEKVSLKAPQPMQIELAAHHPAAPVLNLPLPNPLLQQETSSLTMDYTYDALNRLTSATYGDGRSFDYTYDAAGNVLQLEQNLGPGTVTTTYTYDVANQLSTAEVDNTTWHYTYDANGSLTEVLPDGNIASGAKRYTYNAAGNLVQVDQHDGTAWNTQAQMNYNGLNQRLSMDAAGVIAHYVMDGDQPLTADSNGNATYYLYGLGAIAEKTTDWNYSLPDGTNTPRQLTDLSAEITLSTRYTPWGDTLEIHGTGNFTFGYFGGVLDATTGLLYVGNGQYYDPSTGRFLTRDAKPNNSNPYVPWDPTGAIIAPLGVAALFFGRKKKGSKLGTFFVLLIVVGSIGMTLSACNTTVSGYNVTTTPTSTPNTYHVTATPTTVPSQTPSPTGTPSPTITLTCTVTATPSPIPTTDDDYKRLITDRFGIIISDDTGTWATAHIQIAYSALSNIDTALGGTLKTLLGITKKFLRDWDSTGYSGTTYTNQINFHFNNKLPYQLIYHEMGHLLDNAQGDKYTHALDQTVVYTGYPNQTGERVMGRDCPDNQYGTACKTPPYDRIDGQGYTQYSVINDPSGYNAETEMHPRSMDSDGNTAIEEWGDLFANFVAGNFDSSDIGRAKYNWVKDQLFGG